MSRAEDLTGKKFNRLTALRRDTNRKGTYWICQCDCGTIKSVNAGSLKNGSIQSCGCLNREIISKPKDLSNMIGKRFGKLTIIERAETHVTPSGQRKVIWRCKCDCGNETMVQSQDLKSGHTKSCGCLPKKKRGNGLKDLIGERFGNLVVTKRAEDYQYVSKGELNCVPAWLCKCDCGNSIVVQGGNLRNGIVTNCGCKRTRSSKERYIADFLSENKVKYFQEYYFKDLKREKGRPLRFDFAILNDADDVLMLVEYQGEQHYRNVSYGSFQREYSDIKKKEYCKSKDIPLYEIRYDEDLDTALGNLLDTINSLKFTN